MRAVQPPSSSSPLPRSSDAPLSSRRGRLILPQLAATTLLVALLMIVSACGTSSSAATATATPQPVTLKVFAAASLDVAFPKIGTEFTALHPNVTFSFDFAGSDTLATQITQGAPADVFASANNKQMNVTVSGGEIDSSTVQVFAHNRLVVVVPTSNPGNIQTLQDLAKPGVKVILAASTVPAGEYALDFLTNASTASAFGTSYKADVLKNVVSYQTDVTSVLSQIALGQADAGIVYVTDAATQPNTLTTIAIPDNLNVIAIYNIAPVKSSKEASTAQQFIAFVLSSTGQTVMASYGFLSPTAGPLYTPPAS